MGIPDGEDLEEFIEDMGAPAYEEETEEQKKLRMEKWRKELRESNEIW